MVVSKPAEMIVDEDEFQITSPLWGYIDAKRTSRESSQRFRQREGFEWTKVTGGIRFWPQFMEDQKRVLDRDDHFTVLTEWGSRKLFDVHGHAWAFTRINRDQIADRAAKKNIRLWIASNDKGRLRGCEKLVKQYIRYLCVHSYSWHPKDVTKIEILLHRNWECNIV